jgi:hypothetical protein
MALIVDIVFISIIASAAPTITDWYNNKTGDSSTYIVVGGSTERNSTIFFNVTANESIITWNWSINNNSVVNNYDNYTYTFSKGYNWVDVYGSNENGVTNTIEWHIYVLDNLGSQITRINISLTQQMVDLFIENKSFTGIIEKSTHSYRDFMGNLFFVLFYGVIFLMMWIRQGNIIIPSVIGLMLGGMMIAMLPAEYHAVAVVFISMGVFAVLYTMFKSRY